MGPLGDGADRYCSFAVVLGHCQLVVDASSPAPAPSRSACRVWRSPSASISSVEPTGFGPAFRPCRADGSRTRPHRGPPTRGAPGRRGLFPQNCLDAAKRPPNCASCPASKPVSPIFFPPAWPPCWLPGTSSGSSAACTESAPGHAHRDRARAFRRPRCARRMRRYFAELMLLVDGSSVFNVLAHCDYPRRYWPTAPAGAYVKPTSRRNTGRCFGLWRRRGGHWRSTPAARWRR